MENSNLNNEQAGQLPLITVAMVTYNSARYVAMAIDSVLASSYQDVELVISDDNSKDETWKIIQSYSDPRIKAVKNDLNIGEYANRNRCIDMASGEYLIFIDGDDMVYPHGLEFMTKMLHRFPDCAMALMRWYKKNIFYPVVITPRQLYQGIYFQYGFNDIAFANTLFRTSVLKASGNFPPGIKAGDNYIRLKIGLDHNTLLINDHLTFWRETPGQASSSIYKNLKGIVEHYQMYFNFLDEAPFDNNEKKEALQNLKIQVVVTFFGLQKKGKFADGLFLLKEFNISLTDLRYYFRKPIYKDPFEDYTPDNLYRLPLSCNPYSREPSK